MTRAVYLIETMPDYLRESHRAAGNWGVYPHNGAERRIVDESELPAEDDEYDHIVALASERDIALAHKRPHDGEAQAAAMAALEHHREVAAEAERVARMWGAL